MFFVRAAFWIFLILLLMPTNDKEKSDFYTVASRTMSDLSGFCTRNPQVCDSTGALFDALLSKMRNTVEMLEDMVQPGGGDGRGVAPDQRPRESEHRPQRGVTGSLPIAPTRAGSQHTLRPDDLQPAWRGPGRV